MSGVGTVEVPQKGRIDWVNRMVYAEGLGNPPMRPELSEAQRRIQTVQAAFALGYRNLAATAAAVQILPDNALADLMTAQPQSDVTVQISAVISGARKSSPEYLADGTVRIELSVPLFGIKSLAASVNYSHLIQQRLSQPLEEVRSPADVSGRPKSMTPVTAPVPLPKTATGLIVDASGLGLEPALVPLIRGAEQYLYPRPQLSLNQALLSEQGLVQYAGSLDEAQANTARVGERPLIVRARAVQGQPHATDLILKNADLELIKAIDAQNGMLQALKVILVL